MMKVIGKIFEASIVLHVLEGGFSLLFLPYVKEAEISELYSFNDA